MLVLGIDTATRVASVGLVRAGELLAEESCWAVSNHTQTLLPLLLRLLAHCGVVLSDVQGIGVSVGPGSFTGLRIAVGTVKGLAYALGSRVVGVSTLEALARTVADWEGEICSILDARKGEVYLARFHRDKSGMLDRLTPDQVGPPRLLLSRLKMPCLFVGDGVETYADLIQERCGEPAHLLPFTSQHPRGTVVARMAWERLCQGEQSDLSTLVPCYVRRPEAEFKRTN